jgi:hypothetical protein
MPLSLDSNKHGEIIFSNTPILELTLVQEGVTWFEKRGFMTERLAVKVSLEQNR